MLDAADRAAMPPGGTDMASRELIDDRQPSRGLGYLWPRLQELTKILPA